jgi:hypothetical protein
MVFELTVCVRLPLSAYPSDVHSPFQLGVGPLGFGGCRLLRAGRCWRALVRAGTSVFTGWSLVVALVRRGVPVGRLRYRRC